MSFKQNTKSPFRPSIDPFKGRGEQGGLTHGGQYSVDYVLDAPKKAKRPTRQQIASKTSFLRDTPPVSAPRPTKKEVDKMKSAAGDFKNIVTGQEREEIRELLKGYTCFKQPKEGYLDNCGGTHASWQVAQGKCEQQQVGNALDKLQKCAQGYFGDEVENLKRCTNYQLDLGGIGSFADKKRKGEYLKEMAGKYLRELEQNIVTCKASRQEGGQFVYGCMDERATNYSPNANVEDGTCEFDPISLQPDGAFDNNAAQIDSLIDPYLRGEDGDLGQSYTPIDLDTKQAGFGVNNPMLLIGALAVAGLVIFMANRKPAATMAV